MARIELAPGVASDFERILDHLAAHRSERGEKDVAMIIEALDVLEQNPRIGRPTTSRGKRELIIGPGGTGYAALYQYFEEADLVIVFGIRAQREAGYAH